MKFFLWTYTVLGTEVEVLCRKYYGYRTLATKTSIGWKPTEVQRVNGDYDGEFTEISKEEASLILFEAESNGR